MMEGIVTRGLPCRVTNPGRPTWVIAVRGRNRNGKQKASARRVRQRKATAEQSQQSCGAYCFELLRPRKQIYDA